MPETVLFVDATRQVGLDFVHFNGMAGELYMAEVTGSGVALLDYDGDGDLDAYFVQGAMLGPGKTLADALFPPHHPPPVVDRLYRNELSETGELRFTDATADSGQIGSGYGMGVAVGDYDNDGRPDLYVTNFGANQLLRNLGDGTFRDVTAAAGADDPLWSVPAAFVDVDRDGWLDLFVGNYVDFPLTNTPLCRDMTGAQDYCGPDSFHPESDRLLRNQGDGTFRDITAEVGMVAGFGPALGVVAADFNGDDRIDLYIANDQHSNQLWMQQADGSFRDEALLAGSSVNASGQAEASMGVDAADFDHDGDLDLFMTHLVTETNTLYRNDGTGMFDDHTLASGLGPASRTFTSFGTGWFDYDQDGWLDLVVVNGAVKRIEALARQGDPFPLHQTNQLFRNLGGTAFADATATAGAAFDLSEVSRGVAFGDVDNDGDVDLLIVNNNGPARLLLNQVGAVRPWLGLRLLTGDPPRDALGARAALIVDGTPRRWQRLRVEGSFASASDPRLVFALEGLGEVEAVRVFWPDGASETWNGLAAGRYHELRQGRGSAMSE